jgi:hypothetical protein
MQLVLLIRICIRMNPESEPIVLIRIQIQSVKKGHFFMHMVQFLK